MLKFNLQKKPYVMYLTQVLEFYLNTKIPEVLNKELDYLCHSLCCSICIAIAFQKIIYEMINDIFIYTPSFSLSIKRVCEVLYVTFCCPLKIRFVNIKAAVESATIINEFVIFIFEDFFHENVCPQACTYVLPLFYVLIFMILITK